MISSSPIGVVMFKNLERLLKWLAVVFMLKTRELSELGSKWKAEVMLTNEVYISVRESKYL